MGVDHRISVFCRGFAIVACTTANVAQIAGHHFGGAFVMGGAISYLWWGNANKAGNHAKSLGKWYAFGAACGTVTAMWVVSWFYRG